MSKSYKGYLQSIIEVLKKGGIEISGVECLDFEELKDIAEIVDQLLYINDILVLTDNKNKISTYFTSGQVLLCDATRAKFRCKKVLTGEKMSNQDVKNSVDNDGFFGGDYSGQSEETNFGDFGLLNPNVLENTASRVTDRVESEIVPSVSSINTLFNVSLQEQISKENVSDGVSCVPSMNALLGMLPQQESQTYTEDYDSDTDDEDDSDYECEETNYVEDETEDSDYTDDSAECEIDTDAKDQENFFNDSEDDVDDEDLEFDYNEDITNDYEDIDGDAECVSDENEDLDVDSEEDDVEFSYDEDIIEDTSEDDDIDDEDLEYNSTESIEEGYAEPDDDFSDDEEDSEDSDLDVEYEEGEEDDSDLEFDAEDYEIPEESIEADELDDEDLEMDSIDDFEEYSLDDENLEDFDEDDDVECPQDEDFEEVSLDSKGGTAHEDSSIEDGFEEYDLDDDAEFYTDTMLEGVSNGRDMSSSSTGVTNLNSCGNINNINKDVDVAMAEGIVNVVNKAFSKLTSLGKNK